MKHILFVCTGNTCRSPFAHGLMTKMAEDAGLPIEVRSAGIATVDGLPIATYMEQILQEKGYDKPFSSQMLDEQTIAWADLILTMTMNHKQHVIMEHPQAMDKTFTLKEYVGLDPEEQKIWNEREQFLNELQLKQSLNEPLTDEEQEKWDQWTQELPDLDIADPFGGSEEVYRECAGEIEALLTRLLDKLKDCSE